MNTFESWWQDFRYGARVLRLNPGFFAVAALSLALGIGANTAIFQLLNAVRLRTLPVAKPAELAELTIADNDHCCSGNFSSRYSRFTYAQWEQIRDHQQAFSGLFAWGDNRFDLTKGGEVRFAEGLWVSGDFFSTLDVQPRAGRLISKEDDQRGCGSPGAVISYAFWQRLFGGDPQIIGKNVSLDGRLVPVMGVTPAGFFGVEVGRSFDVALPLCAEPAIKGEQSHMSKRHHWWLAIMGRLKPDWTIASATAQAQAMSRVVFENTVPPNYRPDQAKYYVDYKLTAEPAGSGVSSLRKEYEEPLLLLLAIAGLVLLIACANLANLGLARASTRQREMAIRLAIGASRGRLIRQLLSESLVLTAVGTVLGALLAQYLSSFLVSFLATGDNPLFLELHPDWRVLAFTAGVAVATCLLFGLTPALRATQGDPATAMKSSNRGLTASRERFGLRRILVIGQVALSLVLLVGALLFVRSLGNLLTVDAGFRQSGLLITGIAVARLNYAPERRAMLYKTLLGRLRATPGVEEAATVRNVPISGDFWNDDIEIFGHKSQQKTEPWFNRVSDGYFRTIGTPLISGRDFDERDTPSSPEVAIVNQEFSKEYLGGANPIGQEFRIVTGPGELPHLYQIVGVAKNSKYRTLREEIKPTVFVADSQDKEPSLGQSYFVRSSAPLGSLTADLKHTILSENPEISIEFQPFQTQVEDSLLRERLMATLSGFFGFLAAVLATVGLYGVISYMVARRRNEIGIRIALGASRSNVIRLVISEAGILLLVGFAIGTVLSLLATRAATSMLYGLTFYDPATIVFAVLLLASVAFGASLLPALRAAGLQPMAALREE